MSTTAMERSDVPLKFDRIAKTYDLLTGANPGYRRHLEMSARRMELPEDARILDLCCGTGASTEALRAAYPHATLVGLDASTGMLERARTKTHLGATFVHGDAMDPAASGIEGPFDAVFMAYGIRNMSDPDLCLQRVQALLKPGGVWGFHDYSLSGRTVHTALWTAVCWGIIIPGGVLTAASTSIYTYLWRSALGFDRAPDFVDRLGGAGLEDAAMYDVDGWQKGIVHTFVARKPS